MLREMLWVSIGAILGANLRYLVYRLSAHTLPADGFPYATLAINVSGSFVLAWFAFSAASHIAADPKWRLLFAVGFCGSFTTFSTFALESQTLFSSGKPAAAGLNILLSNLLCIAAVSAGALLAPGVRP